MAVLDLGRAFNTHVAVSNAARVGVIYAQQVYDPTRQVYDPTRCPNAPSSCPMTITVQDVITRVTAEPQGGIDPTQMRVKVCVPFNCYPYPNPPSTPMYT